MQKQKLKVQFFIFSSFIRNALKILISTLSHFKIIIILSLHTSRLPCNNVDPIILILFNTYKNQLHITNFSKQTNKCNRVWKSTSKGWHMAARVSCGAKVYARRNWTYKISRKDQDFRMWWWLLFMSCWAVIEVDFWDCFSCFWMWFWKN